MTGFEAFFILGFLVIAFIVQTLPLIWIFTVGLRQNNIRIGRFSLLLLLFSITPSFFCFGYVYLSERLKTSSASWNTLWLASDFALGYTFIQTTMVFLFVVSGYATEIITDWIPRRIYRLDEPLYKGQPFLTVVRIIVFMSPLIIGLYYLGNCSFITGHWLEPLLFGKSGQLISFSPLDALFLGSCNFVPIGSADVVAHPVKISNAYLHITSTLSNLGISSAISQFIAIVLPAISFLADILGIYLYIESRRSRKKRAG